MVSLRTFCCILDLYRRKPEDGPWRVGTDSAAVYRPILSYCSNRDERKNLWRSLVNVASNWHTTQSLHNKTALENIRMDRFVCLYRIPVMQFANDDRYTFHRITCMHVSVNGVFKGTCHSIKAMYGEW